MARKKQSKRRPRKAKSRIQTGTPDDPLALYQENRLLRKQIEKLNQFAERSEDRLQDLEIHINLLTRLFTTLCIEKFGMRIGVLKRFIKRIEKEAIRDSQILHLESLYKLPHPPEKDKKPPAKGDPWDEIS